MKISQDVAKKEVDAFLFETKKISREDLEGGRFGPYAQADYLRLVGDVMTGKFYFKDDKIIQVLDFPLENGKVKELVYSARLKAKDLTRVKYYDLNDIEGRQKEVICILTDQAAGIIGDMDSLDFERAKRLQSFYFLA